MVLDLVPEEGTRAVDLLTSDNGDLLASENLIIEEKKCQRPSVDQLSSPSPNPFSCLARILKSFSLHSYTCHHNHTTLPYCARLDSFSQEIFSETLTCLATTEASRPRR